MIIEDINMNNNIVKNVFVVISLLFLVFLNTANINIDNMNRMYTIISGLKK